MAKMRILIVKNGCPHCREAVRVISAINLRLHQENKIKIIDNYTFESFGYSMYPIAHKFKESDGFTGYPFLYMDGIVFEAGQRVLLGAVLEGFLGGEIIA